MSELIGSLLDNNSPFGRIMTRFGIIIGANLMFLLFSFPLVTVGPAYVALYHVMLRTLRGDGVLNPFKEFWKGFRSNFRQAMIVWLSALLLAFVFYLEFRIVGQMSGSIEIIRYPLLAIAAILLMVVIYSFPVMAAFADSIPHLLRNAIFFILKKPWKMLIIAFFNIFPMYLTYSDPQYMPLYAFLWIMFGFGAVALLGSVLLLPEFKPFLPLVDDEGDFLYDEDGNVLMPGQEGKYAAAEGGPEMTDREALDVMKKLGM